MPIKNRIGVVILAQIVETDGTPVNQHGEIFGRGWKLFCEWVKRGMSADKFCPVAVQRGLRVVRYRNPKKDPTVVRCRCHGKIQLTKSKVEIG